MADQIAAIQRIFNEDPAMTDLEVFSDELPFPVILICVLDGAERRWGRNKIAIYAYKEDGKAKYVGVEWYDFNEGSEGGDPEISVFPATPQVESVTRWSLAS